MKKRIACIVFSLILTMGVVAVPVLAADAGSGNPLYIDSVQCIPSEEDRSTLDAELSEISARQECEVVLCVTDNFGGKTSVEYADDYYVKQGYGWGKENSGILLLINPQTRDWAVSTCGFGITAFTDAGQEYIIDQLSEALSEDDYLTAFHQYADWCDTFLTQAHTGEPYDEGTLPGQEAGIVIAVDLIVGIILGVIAAFIVVGSDKEELKTVRREAAAKNYIRSGSLQITKQYENFLYKKVDKTKKESSSGSSTHESESGTTHGGSSGKF